METTMAEAAFHVIIKLSFCYPWPNSFGPLKYQYVYNLSSDIFIIWPIVIHISILFFLLITYSDLVFGDQSTNII